MRWSDLTGTNRVAWEVVSYLALDPSDQVLILGPAEQWFCKEHPEVNPGANYLFGTAQALAAFKNNLSDSGGLAENSALAELAALLRLMTFATSEYVWSVSQLRDCAVWRLVRRLASLLMSEVGLQRVPPDLFEVEGYPLLDLPFPPPITTSPR